MHTSFACDGVTHNSTLMHLLSLIGQAIGQLADRVTIEHVSTLVLIHQQLQLREMKVKLNAVWHKFAGVDEEKDDEDIKL